ncbi:amino acid ABC transporter ATP-binding protein [Haloarcula hispanica N601]|uniref:Probable branched-chain amino acid transport ATP-binding protein LivG n=4 Tax=Halobacteriales TaxID=2235 RepID=A0A482T5J6_HALHI|nr:MULTISPECIES: ABC transporter ATP-binding protein [Haloarcula]AEM56022.1 branched-chain amino acid ABC transporter, ATP-binding protein [Haloarcula hispanica ATCC 33960]AHB64835.1 amino acid ABC transporter ATP-binding protein [Haloarcula hispanica N601]AJF26009.1 branched-chain amino acid ABC transporter substrate-binding protein [Haloarcula sp. CBA1115]KAA9405353.1 ABC transporter ATP-binding protein [Haloarcula sp. CBA1131]KAA9408756.1 ABC transporter ATP-binding protein [Haloarcula hisp
MTVLKTERLTKQFGGLTAVDEVDLEIEQGEGVSLIGPNGAGKSTFINLVTRRLEPSYGEIAFQGDSIIGMDPHEVVQRGMSKSFQTASIFPELTVKENATIAALAAEHGSFRFNFFRNQNSYPAVDELANEVLESVGLYDERENQADSLDYGNKRRLELGIALAAEPDMLLMDEPTAGMSPEETKSTVDLIKRVKDELDLTFLLVEHDMEIVFDISDRIIVLNRGSVIAKGTPDQVQDDPAVQEAYLGGVEE